MRPSLVRGEEEGRARLLFKWSEDKPSQRFTFNRVTWAWLVVSTSQNRRRKQSHFATTFHLVIHFGKMPPKSNGKEKASGMQGGEEEILQAVILADSFNNRFKPLTVNKPRVCDRTHGIA